MNNEQLQGFLTRVASIPADILTPSTFEGDTIVRWMLSADGPVAIADEAAWELVTSECYSETLDGHTWWRTHPSQLTLQIDEDGSIAESISRALRYLSSRGKLFSHASTADLVRWAE